MLIFDPCSSELQRLSSFDQSAKTRGGKVAEFVLWQPRYFAWRIRVTVPAQLSSSEPALSGEDHLRQ